jgi:large subunit ribosomal protein L5
VAGEEKKEADSIPRMKQKYLSEVIPQLVKDFGYKNLLQAPRIQKIVVNMGLGEAIQNIKVLDHASEELGLITGQKPIVTRAKKSISNFKLRAGMPIGCAVTLRRQRMYEFFDRLINIALPRVRDFRGISGKAFDGRGNYTLGIREQIIFPEINYDKIDKIRGMNITIVTSAKTDEEAKAFLKYMGMPFRN